MPGCNFLGPINVYERPAAAITDLVKCLRMDDTKGPENNQNCHHGTLAGSVAPLQADQAQWGPSGSHAPEYFGRE